VFDHRRFHQAGQDCVDANMSGCEFDRGGARHLVHRRLGGGVADIGNAEMRIEAIDEMLMIEPPPAAHHRDHASSRGMRSSG